MDRDGAWQQVGAARVARLATIGADGRPDLVPVTFALRGSVGSVERLIIAIDHKPKSTRRLTRLDNIRARPDVSLLVDHYDDDWSQLWWVRIDGRARVVDGPPVGTDLDALRARYEPYHRTPPAGPVIDIELRRWQWWSAADAATPDAPTTAPTAHGPNDATSSTTPEPTTAPEAP